MPTYSYSLFDFASLARTNAESMNAESIDSEPEPTAPAPKPEGWRAPARLDFVERGIRVHADVELEGTPRQCPARHSKEETELVYPLGPNIDWFMQSDASAEDKWTASQIVARYGHRPEAVALRAQLLKSFTARKEGTDHRKVVSKTIVKVPVVRPLTMRERMAAMRGDPVPSVEERTTLEETVVQRDLDMAKDLARMSPYEPYSQQVIGAWAIVMAGVFALFYDMRVGKTMTAIIALRKLMSDGLVSHGIVVCPRANIYRPWVNDLKEHSLRVIVLDGSPEEDALSLSDPSGYDVILMNYERVQSRTDMIFDVISPEDVFAIFDETSKISNPDARRTKACWRLSQSVGYATVMNGTPVTNGPGKLYAQMRILDPWGIRWGVSFSEYKERFLIKQGFKYVIKNAVAQMELECLIYGASLRYLRSEADQYDGKDKQFRYIEVRPSKEQVRVARMIGEGFLSFDGDIQELDGGILQFYGLMRELACGYSKIRPAKGVPYRIIRHDVDPKLLWAEAFMSAYPDEPIVFVTEFDEQEEGLKDLLERIGRPYSSLKPRASKVIVRSIKERLPACARSLFSNGDQPFLLTSGTELIVPLAIRERADLVSTFPAEYVDVNYDYVDGRGYSNLEREEQIRSFCEGDTDVFILKTSQGTGINLSRKEAVAKGTGTYPSMIMLCPSWNLTDDLQVIDRCVTTDPKTKRTTCTMIYRLYSPGMEKQILDALKKKKSVQDKLLRDAEDESSSETKSRLVEAFASKSDDGDEVFDADNVRARILLGVPPFGKLTLKRIERCAVEKLGRNWRQEDGAVAAFNLLGGDLELES